ncbi:carbon storage regulator CsrA [Paenibacillus methanolicus]|uniref:Translational regulator CsrA n=1 Tax=Paenibacillus methanolicus TaxID=582686 RepID=A0A5S5CBK8_9BACL|nr:carbon storage regulator CsrA [Paenibacillus methanolicus]TYP75726.1 carbon storage regulator [Paenibacillus methanolicus]
MLVLARKSGESIMIAGNIEVVVVSVEGDNVKLGIRAPKEVEIFRKEIYLNIQASNKEAAQGETSLNRLADLLRGNAKGGQ